jgi:hypothetical protein
MAGLRGGDEPHAAVAAIDAGFEDSRRGRGVLHDWNQQKDHGNKQNASHSGTTYKGDVH